jgi:hypothetical protein
MANLKYYNETNSEWETLVIGKQGPSGIANATAPVTYDGGTQTVGLTDAFIGQTVRTYANASARATAIPTPSEGMLTYLEDLDRYESYTAGAWITVADASGWTDFTPVFGGLTIGDGFYSYSKFKKIGKTVNVQVRFVLGSTSSVSGDLRIDVPSEITRVTADSPGNIYGAFIDASANSISPISILVSSVAQRFFLRATNASTTYLTSSITSATVPFTWAASDNIIFSATYEVA